MLGGAMAGSLRDGAAALLSESGIRRLEPLQLYLLLSDHLQESILDCQ